MVVAPALHASALRFWVSDADEAIKRADAVRRESAEQLGDDGVAAVADTGEGDIEAVQDALRPSPPTGSSSSRTPPVGALRRGRERAELRERFGLPVDRAEVARRDETRRLRGSGRPHPREKRFSQTLETESPAAPSLAISNAISRLHKQYVGRGPTNARTTMDGEFVVCLIEGGTPRPSRHSRNHDRGERGCRPPRSPNAMSGE